MFLRKLGLVFILMTSCLVQAEIITGRCPEKGDNLDAEKAKARWDWIKRCDPVGFRYGIRSQVAIENGAARITYPIYGVYTNLDNATYQLTGWKAPIDANAPCHIPEKHEIVAFCFAGCYTPDQEIIFLSQDSGLEFLADYLSVKSVKQTLRVKALDSLNETWGAQYVEGGLPAKLVTSLIDEEHKILEISMERGESLKVTDTHPLLRGDQKMVAAYTLRVGDSLINELGEKVEITQINKRAYNGKVWNVDVQSDTPWKKIVVAQGFLSGDVSFQNENAKLLNSMLLREKLPLSLLE